MTTTNPTPRGHLAPGEPHPAAHAAKSWFLDYLARHDPAHPFVVIESFASCAIEGNRTAELCSETLRRLMASEPVSDRYILALCWTLRDMEDAGKAEARP